MISDEERRHAATELRTAAGGEFRHVDALDVIAGAIGVDVSGMYTHEAESKVYAALADLIDRPTCTVSMGVTGHVGVCMRCGALVETRAAVFNAIEALPTRYCPNCGAEVVSDGDD